MIHRDITQVCTPGTYVDEQLEDAAPRFLIALIEDQRNNRFGLVAVDSTTHEFFLDEFKEPCDKLKVNLSTILHRLKPVEVLYYKELISPETMKLCKGVSNPTFG